MRRREPDDAESSAGSGLTAKFDVGSSTASAVDDETAAEARAGTSARRTPPSNAPAQVRPARRTDARPAASRRDARPPLDDAARPGRATAPGGRRRAQPRGRRIRATSPRQVAARSGPRGRPTLGTARASQPDGPPGSPRRAASNRVEPYRPYEPSPRPAAAPQARAPTDHRARQQPTTRCRGCGTADRRSSTTSPRHAPGGHARPRAMTWDYDS